MPEIDLVALRTAAQEFSREHLTACCAEMVELANTGVLPQGRVRELATMCATFAGSDGLKVAEAMVKHEAMFQVANGGVAVEVATQRTLPPRGQPVELDRWGKAAPDTGLLLQRKPDGYWTPWHVAQAALEAARGAQAIEGAK